LIDAQRFVLNYDSLKSLPTFFVMLDPVLIVIVDCKVTMVTNGYNGG